MIKKTDWMSITVVVFGFTTFAMVQGLIYPLISLLLAERGVSNIVNGLNKAFFMIGLITSTLAMPTMTQKLRASHLITVALFITAIILTGFAFSESLLIWFILRFAFGYCVNIIYVIGEAWLNTVAPNHIRGRVSGIYSTGVSGGFALGPLGIPLFISNQGLAFVFCAFLVGGMGLLFTRFTSHTRIEPKAMPTGRLIYFIRNNLRLISLVLIFGIIETTVLSIIPIYLRAEGASPNDISLYATATYIGVIISQPVIGFMLDHINRWRVVKLSLMLSGFSFFLLGIFPVKSTFLWAVAMLNGSTFFTIYTCALSLLGQTYADGELVVGSAAFAIVYAIGGAIFAPIAGATLELVPIAPILLLAIISCIASFLTPGRWNT